jgi:HSP20 family protein
MSTPATTATPSSTREITERAARTIAPRVDIYETDLAYLLLADMPGVAPDGLAVVVERDLLTVKGRTVRPSTEPDYREFELADYRRTFTLTEDLDTDKITAALRDGVLRVEIPKSPRLQPKKIPVRVE